MFTIFQFTIVDSFANVKTSSIVCLGIFTSSSTQASTASSINEPNFSAHSFASSCIAFLLQIIHFCRNVGVILSTSCFDFLPVGSIASETLFSADLSNLGDRYLPASHNHFIAHTTHTLPHTHIANSFSVGSLRSDIAVNLAVSTAHCLASCHTPFNSHAHFVNPHGQGNKTVWAISPTNFHHL